MSGARCRPSGERDQDKSASARQDCCRRRCCCTCAGGQPDRKRPGSGQRPAARVALSARARLSPRPGRVAVRAHNLNRLISFSGIVGGAIIHLVALWLLVAELEAAGVAATKKLPASLFDDDLIEGRLDTSQLCGTRYPVGPFRQLESADQSEAGSLGPEEAARAATRAQQRSEEPLAGGEEQSAAQRNLLYIVGGDEVDEGQFWPWSVAIYELDPLNGRRGFICSGSLISDSFILTAAHCIQQSRFDTLEPEEVSLKIASTRLDDERAHFYQVDRIFIHPHYTVDRKTNDIALLRLRPKQRLPLRARPICLPSQLANRVDFTDQPATIIGWGKTSAMQGDEPSRLIELAPSAGLARNELNESDTHLLQRHTQSAADASGQTNDTLLQAEVRVTSTDQCNRNYSRLEISWLNIDEHFLCASDPQGKRDACQGDSGGPLMWNKQQALFSSASGSPLDQLDGPAGEGAQEKWYQLGLVSFGYGCANQQYPGVYTRISYYMPWILRTIKSSGRQQH